MAARILLVEDDDDLREVMAGALAADGHDVSGPATPRRRSASWPTTRRIC